MQLGDMKIIKKISELAQAAFIVLALLSCTKSKTIAEILSVKPSDESTLVCYSAVSVEIESDKNIPDKVCSSSVVNKSVNSYGITQIATPMKLSPGI